MQDLTTGSILRHLMKTTSFMLVSMIFQTLYVLVDLYWVGRLGKEAVAAVAVAGNLTFVVLAVTQMLGVGTTTLVSHAAGRRDQPRALLLFNQSQVLATLVGALFLAIAWALRWPYVQALSADGTTATLAAEYLAWFIPAMALQFAMVAMGAALRGTGNFKPGMIVQSATVVLNMVLAPFFVFGWGTGVALGVAGAALSTFVAVVVGVAWLSTYFVKPAGYLHFARSAWPPQPRLWGQMLRLGLPAGAEFALMAVFLFIVYAVSRPFGAAAQAGFGIGQRIVQAGFLPVVALGFAVAPVAGQNFGARQRERVLTTFRSAATMAAAVMLALTALCHAVPEEMVGFFTSDPRVIAVGVEYLEIISWSFAGSGIIFVASSMFQAVGNTLPPLIASLTRLVLVGVPVVALSGHPAFSLRWIWLLSVATVMVQLAVSLLLLRREFETRLRFAQAPAA